MTEARWRQRQIDAQDLAVEIMHRNGTDESIAARQRYELENPAPPGSPSDVTQHWGSLQSPAQRFSYGPAGPLWSPGDRASENVVDRRHEYLPDSDLLVPVEALRGIGLLDLLSGSQNGRGAR